MFSSPYGRRAASCPISVVWTVGCRRSSIGSAFQNCAGENPPPHSAVPFDQIDEFYFLPVSAPDEEIVGREELETLNRAIAELPPRCKHVFSLAKIERLPYRDIAEMLGISVKTVNYHIAYAMEALARTLKR